MKNLIILLAIVLSVFTLDSCKQNATQKNPVEWSPTGEKKVVYTCPMHPEVTSDKPGTCPKCGMTLVEKTDSAKVQ